MQGRITGLNDWREVLWERLSKTPRSGAAFGGRRSLTNLPKGLPFRRVIQGSARAIRAGQVTHDIAKLVHLHRSADRLSLSLSHDGLRHRHIEPVGGRKQLDRDAPLRADLADHIQGERTFAGEDLGGS